MEGCALSSLSGTLNVATAEGATERERNHEREYKTAAGTDQAATWLLIAATGTTVFAIMHHTDKVPVEMTGGLIVLKSYASSIYRLMCTELSVLSVYPRRWRERRRFCSS